MVAFGQLYARPFPDLFGDALFLHYRAEACEDTVESSILAKASILNALLSIEAAANCCVDRLKLPPDKLAAYALRLKKKPGGPNATINPNRWPTLDKYLLLFLAKTNTKINQGDYPIQLVRELIHLRHAFVHPQVSTHEVLEVPLYIESRADGSFYGEFSNMPTSDNYSRLLKIPQDGRLLRTEHSKAVLTATVEFFNYFFCDLLEFDAILIAKFLYNRGPSNPEPYALKHQEELFRTIEARLSITPRFLLITQPVTPASDPKKLLEHYLTLQQQGGWLDTSAFKRDSQKF